MPVPGCAPEGARDLTASVVRRRTLSQRQRRPTLRQSTSSAEYACQADSQEACTLSASKAWHSAAHDCPPLP